jgi:formylglycine-generating enzyme required for sulfatase activity
LFFRKKAFYTWMMAIPFAWVANVARAQYFILDTIPGTEVSFRLSLIPGGIFTMGSPADDPYAQSNEKPARQVLVDSFWMGIHEVSYDEFILFYHRERDSDTSRLTDRPYSADAITRPTPQYIDYTYGMGKEGYPAVSMTQQGALRYCQWLYLKTGTFYRLPTEAEWEFACHAGKQKVPLPADLLAEYAWFYDNSFEKYHPTGQKKPNALGLQDMLGNVAEWTLDFYDESYLQNQGDTLAVNPWLPPARRHSRTVRGGSYDSAAADCRCSARRKSDPRWQARDPQIPKSLWWNPDSPFVGFRLVRPFKQPTPEEVVAFFAKAIRD